jgi:WS/DGAT/MGAT family acyltransferase
MATASDRLSPLDASFLHVEDATSHMHVAAVLVFAGRPPSYDDFLSHISARLGHVPRYRQRLAWVPLAQGRPKWVDDDAFDLRYHVRATALPRPGTEYELQVLAGRVFSLRLNREKPLWEMWLVEGLADDRFAVLTKTHHALVDGISGVDILTVLFGDEFSDDEGEWRPRPAPSSGELLVEAVAERAATPAEALSDLSWLASHPRRAVSRAVELVEDVAEVVRAGVRPAPRTPWNRGATGSDRRFVWVRGDLARVKAVKNALGGTVNDVMLAVVARALRRELERRGEAADGVELKAFVPVSVRGEEAAGSLGNQVTGLIASLPVGCADPIETLSRVSDQMRGLKESGQAVGARALTDLGTGFAQGNLLTIGARLTASRQRVANLVVTNVPGPQFPLRMGDHELLDMFPMVPLGGNLRLGVAILSYNGKISFGLVGDFDAMPDLEELASDFEVGMAELEEAAGPSASPRTFAPCASAGSSAAAAQGAARSLPASSPSSAPRSAGSRASGR